MSKFSFTKDRTIVSLLQKLEMNQFYQVAHQWMHKTLYIHLALMVLITVGGSVHFGKDVPTYLFFGIISAIASLPIILCLEQFAINNLGALYSILPGYRKMRHTLSKQYQHIEALLESRENQYKLMKLFDEVVANYDASVNSEKLEHLQRQLLKCKRAFKKGNSRLAITETIDLYKTYTEQHYQCEMDEFNKQEDKQEEIEQEIGSTDSNRFKF